MKKILIIDDERSIRNALKEILEFEGFSVIDAEDGESGLLILKQQTIDLVFCDIKMPKMDGIEVLDQIIQHNEGIPVVMISGHGTIETAVEAIKKGAFDFIEKPLDLNRILVTLKNAKERNYLVVQAEVLKSSIKKIKGSSIIGESSEINRIKALIEKVAPTDARVLITGANGTGKELVARSLHEKSLRSKMPSI